MVHSRFTMKVQYFTDLTSTENTSYLLASSILDNRHCPPGYFAIAEKCLWFICGEEYHSGAAAKCSKSFGSLASLHPNSLHLVGEYLEHIQVRSVGIYYIRIGLSIRDRKWVWSDGEVHNDSRGVFGYYSNDILAWNDMTKNWELMGVLCPYEPRLHLCERNRGTFMHRSDITHSFRN